MNIEELSKSQLILLMIFVNFVVSVATGILTVSMLDHAPAFVTQTVNRVVERTIETVVAATPAAAVLAPAPAPSNQDLVTSAIGVNATRMVAIYNANTGTSTPAVAVGTYISKSHVVVTAVSKTLPNKALIGFTNGKHFPAILTREGKKIAIYSFAKKATLPKTNSPKLINSSDLKLGETALALGANGTASTGIVSRVSKKGVYTTLPNIGIGSTVVDLSGNLIGISASALKAPLVGAGVILEVLTATSTIVNSSVSAATSTNTKK